MRLGFRFRLRDHDRGAEENADRRWVPALGRQSLVERLSMPDFLRAWRAGGEDMVGEMRRGLNAARRAAGLDQNRPPLRRGHDVERTTHAEELADVIDRLDLVRVGDDAAFAIPDKRIGLDTRPERLA